MTPSPGLLEATVPNYSTCSDGLLTFKSPPDYEGIIRIFNITVTADDGTFKVTMKARINLGNLTSPRNHWRVRGELRETEGA